MGKKFLTAIVLAGLAIPLFSFAEGIQECVKLSRDITIEGSMCTSLTDHKCLKGAGNVVGATGGACDILKASGNNADNFMPTIWVSGGVTVALDDGTAVKAYITERWGLIAIINTIGVIVDWIFAFLVIFAAFYVIMGAYNIVTSAGEPQKVTSGRNYILYAAIGLIVAFIARAIPGLVKSIMGY